MAQEIYKVWLMKYTDAWYRLSPEEQANHMAKIMEALKQVGGEEVMMRTSAWSSEKWLGWGVEKFPSIEAVQQHTLLLFQLKHYLYIEGESYLGIEMPQV
jgi:hypothetical protein